MKPYIRATALLICTAVLWLLILYSDAVRACVTEALGLCAQSVIPALFPFMAVSSVITALGLGELLSAPFGNFMSLWRMDGAAASALIMGFVGGYPMGARTAAELYRARLLTREETERLLTFCNNANPVFLITVLGQGIFGDLRTGMWLWLIHIAAALLTGLLLGRGSRRSAHARRSVPPVFHAASLPAAFVDGVRSALTGTLNVCAFVVIFSLAALPLRAIGGTAGAMLTGALELFSALPRLPAGRAGFVLAAGLAGWGSVSVLCQTAVILRAEGLSAAPCLRGKAVHGLLSALLAVMLAGYVIG